MNEFCHAFTFRWEKKANDKNNLQSKERDLNHLKVDAENGANTSCKIKENESNLILQKNSKANQDLKSSIQNVESLISIFAVGPNGGSEI